jgi:hypothetical protein
MTGSRPTDALLSRRLGRFPLHVWLLWLVAVIVLISCPMLLCEPAMWCYLLDPELLALVVVIGARYTRLQLDLVRWRVCGERRLGEPADQQGRIVDLQQNGSVDHR